MTFFTSYWDKKMKRKVEMNFVRPHIESNQKKTTTTFFIQVSFTVHFKNYPEILSSGNINLILL